MNLLAGTFSIIFLPESVLVVGCSICVLPPGVARVSHLSRVSVAEPGLMDPSPTPWGNFLWEMRGDSLFRSSLKLLNLFSVCAVSQWALWGKTKDVMKVWTNSNPKINILRLCPGGTGDIHYYILQKGYWATFDIHAAFLLRYFIQKRSEHFLPFFCQFM